MRPKRFSMHNNRQFYFYTLWAVCAIVPIAASSWAADSSTGKLSVYVVNYPLKYFAERIGGTHVKVTLPDGSTRTLMPSCSGGPQIVQGVPFPVPADTQYYFFVQAGNPNKILIGLDGGGACWDAATCIGSPLTGNSTYTVALDETPARLANAEGFFDSSNPDNPFHNYTKVFIPYCSGDVHWGSKTTIYNLGGLEWPIHHRGLDNFLGVLDWLQKNGRKSYRVDFGRARDVTVTGASAGGYGANVAFAYVAEIPIDLADVTAAAPSTMLQIVVLAFERRLAKGVEPKELMPKIIRRAIILFLLGLFLAGYPFFTFSPDFGIAESLSNIRIPGVLQRIAICYAVVSLLYLFSTTRVQVVVSVVIPRSREYATTFGGSRSANRWLNS